MIADKQRTLSASRRMLSDMFWQVLSLGLIPGAIVVATALRPDPGAESADSPLWQANGHGSNCPICARSSLESRNPYARIPGDERVVSSRVPNGSDSIQTRFPATTSPRDSGQVIDISLSRPRPS